MDVDKDINPCTAQSKNGRLLRGPYRYRYAARSQSSVTTEAPLYFRCVQVFSQAKHQRPVGFGSSVVGQGRRKPRRSRMAVLERQVSLNMSMQLP